VSFSIAIVSPATTALAVPDLHFDYTSFESTFGQSQFDVLNYPSINGNYMMTSTDNHRPEMVANNNQLAQFYNSLTDRYAEQTTKNGAAAADVIHQYTVNNSTNNGPRPTWMVLNEISSSLWSANPGSPAISTYRTWLIDCVTRLSEHHGYKVVTLAPFQNPGANDASWQALSAIAGNYVGVECYLSGPEVMAGGSDHASRLAWATGQYQASKQSYLNRGVPEDKIFVIEHFANNNTHLENGTPVGWGRAGLASADEWDQVIMIRQDAIKAVGFDGFLTYNWGGNGMGVSVAEQIQHEYYYRSRLVMAGQQPQWLSDGAINVNGTVIPLSWSQPLNWLGGVPNGVGAIANFFRTNTTLRSIPLDGPRTVGSLSFNSPFAYSITPGTGGTLTLNNGAAIANVSVARGNHSIITPVHFAGDTQFDIASATKLTITGDVTAAAGADLTKLGMGTLEMKHVRAASLNVNAGHVKIISNGTNSGTSRVTTLAVNVGAALDVTNNNTIVTGGAVGTWNGSAYSGITGLVASARITSTAPAYGDLTALGVARAGDVGRTSFAGLTVNASDLLLMYTYAGDANLDGKINIDDYGRIDGNVGQSGSVFGWSKGDFNYDGKINIDDYGIIDGNINQQGTPFPTSIALTQGVIGPPAVPEPAGATVLSAAPLLLARRRRAGGHLPQ
jgi:hypothetical protein